MQYDTLLREEKRKLLNLMNYEFVKLDFSKLSIRLDNNLEKPRWMDTYVELYKANLPPDITIYNILLEKLSTPINYFYYEDGDKNYISNANEFMLKAYLNYLITNEKVEYYVKVQFVPHKEYIKEILKIKKFAECGIFLKHLSENLFMLEPINVKFETIGEAKSIYDELLDYNDFYKNVNTDMKQMVAHYDTVLKLSKDKRMLATISNITNFFDLKFNVSDNVITFENTDILIYDEDTANAFQNRVIDAYHFFRNVINTRDKKDIISEIYNRKLDHEIKKQFEENVSSYINIIRNKDLIDWIITISKESDYTLDIKYDDQGIFYINGAIIVTPLDAKEYYIDYMDSKKEKLAVAIYKNNIITKIKRLWNKFRARFAKA